MEKKKRMNEFTNLKINDAIIDALNLIEINAPTPIQEQSIPILLEGKDVIGQAQTGTGKTFAYAIPLIEKLDYTNKNIQALVMCPTRELSLQVSKEIDKLASKLTKIKTATIYGGESYEKQFRALRAKPQVIIGTPGRIIDHLEKGTISFEHVSYLVLDEADEMLKMGFQEDMEKILKNMPTERQTALFSATMPPFIKNVAKKYMIAPEMVKIERKTLTVDSIDQQFYYVKKEQKKDLLVRILDYNQFKSVMIFANTKAMVDELVLYLQQNHFSVDGLHGDLKQMVRDRVMQSFRLASIDILIATDVAARGIDIDGIEAIINFDLPLDNEVYVHRIGRTGRAGRRGTAISLATTRQASHIAQIEAFTKSSMRKMTIPTEEEIEVKNQTKLLDKIINSISMNEGNHKYDNLLIELAKKTTDPTPIIVALLQMVDQNEQREYLPIESVSPKSKSGDYKTRSRQTSTSNRTDRDKNRSRGVNNYAYIEINLGSEDKMRPNQMVNFLHDELNVHREHFGKIVIEKNKSYIELNETALRYFKDLRSKNYNGKKLSYKQISSLPRK